LTVSSIVWNKDGQNAQVPAFPERGIGSDRISHVVGATLSVFGAVSKEDRGARPITQSEQA
jgi:hypothetical protein